MPDWRLKGDPDDSVIAIYSKKPTFTSATSRAIGTGTRQFTVPTGLDVAVNDWFWVFPVVGPGIIAELTVLIGKVTSYSGTSLTINVVRALGEGTFLNWVFQDATPLYDPFTLKSRKRLQMHSAAAAPSTLPQPQSVTINLPSRAWNAATPTYTQDFNLFPHGMGSACLVGGRIMNLGGVGVHVGFSGHVPVYMLKATGLNYTFGTWLQLGSTSTHVVVRAYWVMNRSEVGAAARPAQSFTIEASAFNMRESSGFFAGNPSEPLFKNVHGSHVTIAREKLDSRRRYMQQASSGYGHAIAKGETLFVVGSGKTASPSYAQNGIGWRWRYACDGYVMQTEIGWSNAPTDSGSSIADFIRVKI